MASFLHTSAAALGALLIAVAAIMPVLIVPPSEASAVAAAPALA